MFSPGVCQTSQFEDDLEKIGIKSFIADFSVEKVQTELKESLENVNANKLQSKKGMQIVYGDGRSQVVDELENN